MVYQDENNISYGLNTNLKVLSFNTNTTRRHKKKKKRSIRISSVLDRNLTPFQRFSQKIDISFNEYPSAHLKDPQVYLHVYIFWKNLELDL